MSESRLRGSVGPRLGVWGEVGFGVVSLLASCTPPAPIIKYSGPRLHVRTPAASIRVFPSGVPDRGYLETGTVEIYCSVENNSGALGSVSQSAGCPYDKALVLARQHASDVGADGIFGISSNPAANGNIAMLRATAFRYSSMGEEFPELSATVQRVSAAPEPPQPADAQPPAVQPEPAGEPNAMQDAPPAQPLPVYTPQPVQPVATQAPPQPKPPLAAKPPAAPKPSPSPTPNIKEPMRVLAPNPPAATASRPAAAPAPATARPTAAPKPTPTIVAPPPAVEIPVQTAQGAATLLPAAERLQRLKELRDKRMIPAEMFERRKKELLLEMQKPGG